MKMTENEPVILWFRQDLRMKDNLALLAAHQSGCPIVPLYILDDESSGEWKLGQASRWWLHESLRSLNQSLASNLCLQIGAAEQVLSHLTQDLNVRTLYWNRCYEPWRIHRDAKIQETLGAKGIEVCTFNSSLLFEPPTTLKNDGTPYKVFTPFCQKGCWPIPQVLGHSSPF